jgi:hypothetical protein
LLFLGAQGTLGESLLHVHTLKAMRSRSCRAPERLRLGELFRGTGNWMTGRGNWKTMNDGGTHESASTR